MILSPAKINLSLRIKSQLKNGYHSLSSHMIFLDLFDKIFIEKSSNDSLKIIGPFRNLLNFQNDDNLITKTLEFCRNNKLTSNRFNVTLEKNIPVSGGLGGGSANSASIIRYFLNTKKIDAAENIIKHSKSLGADVPACVYSKPVFIEGIGEKINFIDINKSLDIGIVLMNPKKELSTKNVFSQWLPENQKSTREKSLKVDSLQDLIQILSIGNDLEKTAIKIIPEIKLMLKFFEIDDDCLEFGMSGSGPTCYGIFNDRKIAAKFKKNVILSKNLKNFWVWAGGILSNSKRGLILPLK
ncbi:MAG: 4-(cytidine 5'-diphospho)-2-C-methyl-D-erythritol kinase [Candidatus Puniceispirillales bacterium]